MSRPLNYRVIRRLATYLWPKFPLNSSQLHTYSFISKGGKVLLVSQICGAVIKNAGPSKMHLEDDLKKACEEGDTAIIKLMDQLRDIVILASKEYRKCLLKQIEITKAASHAGPFCDAWDELPEYRVLADKLKGELNDYMTLLNTIGQMSYDDTLIEFVSGNNDKLDDVGTKYKELKVMLSKEFEENSRIERELLQVHRDSILKFKLTY